MNLFSIYSPSFPRTIAYMLQSSEYDTSAYLHWLMTTRNFSAVAHRRQLDKTSVAGMFMAFVTIGILVQYAGGLLIGWWAMANGVMLLTMFALLIIVATPITWALLVIIPLALAKRFVINPRIKRMERETRDILQKHSAHKIAVAGSYGKTTMKELLATVLSEGKRVAATPGNKNVATAHYDFAKSLNGDEEVLIIELGEGKPGDVKRFSQTIKPDIAVITGLAPAHLDHYKDIDDIADDIFSLAGVVKAENLYVNADSPEMMPYIKDSYIQFSRSGVSDWKVSGVDVSIHGTNFELIGPDDSIDIKTGLLGDHLVGVLSTAAVIAKSVGLSSKQIQDGVSKVIPYEHRMQPYHLAGAWIIDDAYNGNLEGIKAGTRLLGKLDAKRKVYVTPGLVDQGKNTQEIHREVGRLIAAVKPDIVVLMKNSVANAIQEGLKQGSFSGEMIVKEDPLAFYQNLDQFVAAGDVVLLQNDWTDNYH